MSFILYHISVTHKNSCIKHDTFGIKGIRPLHDWDKKKKVTNNLINLSVNQVFSKQLHKAILYEQPIQAAMCSCTITMKTYGSEKSPYFPDVPPCTNGSVITFKLNLHECKGLKSLKRSKWLSINLVEWTDQTAAKQLYGEATLNRIKCLKTFCENQQFLIFGGPGCGLPVVSEFDT